MIHQSLYCDNTYNYCNWLYHFFPWIEFFLWTRGTRLDFSSKPTYRIDISLMMGLSTLWTQGTLLF